MTVVWCFSACTAVLSPPAVPTVFSREATVTFGDFTYTCTVTKEESTVTVTPTDTSAAGMTIACDGASVTFTQNEMTQRFDRTAVDVTNPARALWEVLDAVSGDRAEVLQEDGFFIYNGSCSAGRFTLSQNTDGSWHSLQLPAAGITVLFH